jgi:hypothetical protein
MVTKCYNLVSGRRMRVTRLDECNRLVYGADSQATAKGFVSVGLTANSTETEAVEVTDADGEVIVLKPAEQKFTSYTAEIVFRLVDPELFNIITGQRLYRNFLGEVIGLVTNSKIKAKPFALELWAGVSGGDACENPEAQGNFGYMLLPAVRGGSIGDITIESGSINFTISGANSLDGNYWRNGPYNVMLNATDVPSPLPEALDRDDHFLSILVDVEPPAVQCGARPLLDPTTEAITAITAGVTGSVADFTPTPADVSAPVYYEFGDGTFEYLSAGDLGATEHTYAEPGTYEVTATSNNTYAKTTVTIAA